MNRRLYLILLMILSALLICGFSGFSDEPVDLLKDHLINLDKAIDIAKWGSESDKKPSNPKPSATPTPTPTPASQDIKPSSVLIRVNGTKVFVEGEECDQDELEKKIRSLCSGGEKVLLKDEYAEAHVYRKENKLLEKLSGEIGFTYEAQ